MPTKTDHIQVYSEGADGVTPTLVRDYDLTSVLDASTERISSALPDFNGLIWFVSKANGKVGTLDPKTGAMQGQDHERGDRELVRGRQGRRLHRLRQAHVPVQGRARTACRGSSGRRPTRTRGSSSRARSTPAPGTTPTIMDNGYVAITDNADPMNVVVYRTAQQAPRREAHRLRGARVQAGRERDRELADHGRTLADRREQLRLPGPAGPERRRRDRAGLRPRRRQEERHGVHEEVDEHRAFARRPWCRSSRPRPA